MARTKELHASPAYFAASAGDAPIIRQYVEQQRQPVLLAQKSEASAR
jgi:hypothetical protein